MTIEWKDLQQDDVTLIASIAALAIEASERLDSSDKLTIIMDLTACHLGGCRLKLREMAAASPERAFDLLHDVYGINRHIDRETGELRDCFLPRFADLEPTIDMVA